MAKIHFSTAPNYYSGLNTKSIMRDLTIALVIVMAFATVYYGLTYEWAYGIRVVALCASAVATSLAVEAVWCLTVKRDKNVVGYWSTSFPWVTALIMALMCPVNTTFYEMIIGTVFAIVIGKLVFGGFGQNIFNPAVVGRVFMVTSFGSSAAADVVTAATPTSTMATTYNWLITDTASANALLEKFGGLKSLFLGTYTGAMGETSTLLLLILGAWLLFRKDIDWHVPFAFLLTITLSAALVALRFNTGLWYVAYHLLVGGVFFAAVFMVTEPVTNPTSAAGLLIFGTGCGFITMAIRLFGNMPEGVMYSILIMNAFTPWIDYLTAGVQDVMRKRNIIYSVGLFAVVLVVIFVASGSIAPYVAPKAPEFLNSEAPLNLSGDYSKNEAKIISTDTDGDKLTYHVDVKGFAVLVSDYAVKEDNVVDVVISKKDGTVFSVSYSKFSDTEYVGDQTEDERFLSQFVGLGSDGSVDAVTGATVSSTSVAAAVNAALTAYAGGNH